MPLAAVEVFRNTVPPPNLPFTDAPLLVNVVEVPTVALVPRTICPPLLVPFTAVTKVCVVPELFVTPAPLKVSVKLGLEVMVKALAPGSNVSPSTSVFAEMETLVVFERPKRRRVCRAVGHGHWRPVGSGIPVARAGTQIPLGAAC